MPRRIWACCAPQASGQIFQPCFRLSGYPKGMATGAQKNQQQVQLRRSPKLLPFVVVFGFIGFLGTLVVTSLFPADPSVGFVALFGYFSLYGITGAITLGIVVWLLLDRRSKKRATVATLERENS